MSSLGTKNDRLFRVLGGVSFCVVSVFSIYLYINTPQVYAASQRTYTNEHSALLSSSTTKRAVSISPGDYHGCAVTSDQLAYCSGYNDHGQVGDATTTWRSTPVVFQVPATKGVTSVSTTNQFYSCALTSDQLVYCAGYNNNGQLGNGNTTNQSTPVQFQLPAGKAATKIHTNFYYFNACALTTDQLIYCAGINDYGQLGDGTNTNRSTPVQFALPAGKRAVAMSGKQYHFCALTTDQLIYCTGYNGVGELGDGTGITRNSPVQFQLPAGKVPTTVSTGFYHTCSLATDQQVYCSGYNAYGQLGDGTLTSQTTAVQFQLPAGKKAASMVATTYQTCVITIDRLLYCAGYNAYGQLGDTTTIDRSTPVQFQLPGGRTAVAISNTSFLHNCVLTSDQSIYCAGYNAFGQLGNGTSVDQATPVSFNLGGKKAVGVSISSYQSCAITTDKEVYCAGYGLHGQLGNANITHQSTPVKFILP